MKAILSLILLSSVATANAYEIQMADEANYDLITTEGIKADLAFEAQPFGISQKNEELKVEHLEKQLALQKRTYEDKISYLQKELKKSQQLLVDKSIHQLRQEKMFAKNFAEESTYLKREIVAKNKTIMEFQRLVEKFKPGQDTRDLVVTNTELSTELRKAHDLIANMSIVNESKTEAIAKGVETSEKKTGRLPASAETTHEIKK